MTLASHEEYLTTYGVLMHQPSDSPITTLAQSEKIKYVIDRNAKGACTFSACAKRNNEYLPWRNPQRAWCDIYVGVTCGLARKM